MNQVRVHVDGNGRLWVQLPIGCQPLSSKQMRKLNQVVKRQGVEVYGRQVEVDLKTWKVRVVKRKDEI